MLLNKWNYQTHKYDKVEIPDCYNCKTYTKFKRLYKNR